ncbi:hypothetical protein BMT54_10250 [Pasteurellaceae bacterium 15-036681]|nr:hypothetical protein BMT54_10250 [Pasteurellaceae bacterium 15-036681]
MTNILLSIGILLCLAYAIYDQFIMDKLKGETKLAIRLKQQAKLDTGILIGLIVLIIIQSLQTGIEAITLFLLTSCIILAVYSAFIRFPRLLLKPKGFFFGNIYFDYQRVEQINLAEGQILVIDLKGGRRLLVRIQQQQDIEKVVNFFGGYKQ